MQILKETYVLAGFWGTWGTVKGELTYPRKLNGAGHVLTSVSESMNSSCSIFNIQLHFVGRREHIQRVCKSLSASAVILHRSIFLGILDKRFKSQQDIGSLPRLDIANTIKIYF